MKTKLKIHRKFKKALLEEEESYSDIAKDSEYYYFFTFSNDYGLSAVKRYGTHGYDNDRYEIAIHKYSYDDGRFHLCYDTDITDDTIGNLNDEEVMEYLEKVKNLK